MHSLHITTIIAAGISSALGGVVLFGWFTHNVTFIQVLPAFVPMQFNTALGFLLCGIGLFSQASGSKRVAAVCGGAAGVLGLLTIVEYLSGTNLGIDQLFMEHYITVRSSHPGRMAPNTASCFLLSGAALVVANKFANSRHRHLTVGLLASFVIALSIVAFFGYLGDVETAYGWGALTSMAVHTAAGFIMLGTGIFMHAWHEGALEDTTSIVPLWVVFPVGLGMITVVVIFWQAMMTDYSTYHQYRSVFLPYSVLLTGFLMTVLTVITLRLAQVSSRHAAKLEEASLELEKDILKRKRAEELLRDAQQIAHIGNWDWEIVKDTLCWSDEIYRIFGLTPEGFDATYEAFLSSVHPEDRELVHSSVEEALNENSQYSVDHRIVLPDGTVRSVHEQATVILEDGKPVRMIGTVQDITERKEAEEKVLHMAYHDPLTGLPNRALMIDRLNQVIARKQRQEELAAVLFIDLDRFKLINDTLGHAMGDKVLKAVAERLSKHTRKDDTVARQGGDEFILIIQDLNRIEDITNIAEKIFLDFSDPFGIEGHQFALSVSMGVSIFPNDGKEAETLIKNADIAMYAAKDECSNNFRFHTASMNEGIAERLKLENKLRRAIDNEEFLLHYQPQVDTTTGEVIGVEALVRWQEAEEGLISPMDFIPVAEDTGLIAPLGEWVLREACTQNKAWQAEGLKHIVMAVNISIRQFSEKDFLATLERVLKETGLDPKLLELELTESIIVKDVESTIEILEKLREMGVRVSIDDFGTGYSSLAYLKRMPIDMLKIDRTFVMDISTNPDDISIVRATILMAKSMQLDVIAEGVETREQLEMLQGLGCSKVQGYHFSKPLPAHEVKNVLKKEWRFVVNDLEPEWLPLKTIAP